MTTLKLVTEPDPRFGAISDRLRGPFDKVTKFDESLRDIERDLYETLDVANGVGLAAPQVGIRQRICIVRVPACYEYEDSPETRLTLINPQIVRAGGQEIDVEGCLSFPDLIGDVPRYLAITVRAHDINGKVVKIKARDYVARVMQHEIDHLNGVLFFDRMTDWSTLHYPQSDKAEPVTARPPAD